MIHLTNRIHLALLAGTLACAAVSVSSAKGLDPEAKPTAKPAAAAPSAGDEIVKAIDDLVPPKMDREKMGTDPAVREAFMKARAKFMTDRSQLIGDLLGKNADHPRAGQLAMERWGIMAQNDQFTELKADTAKFGERSDKLGSDAAFMNALATGEVSKWDLVTTLKAADGFIARFPGDERGAAVLAELADNIEAPAQKKEIFARMSKDFPAARATKSALAKSRQIDGLGKPFVFKFNDAITGTEVSNETLKGKVLVIDFWATWCGPCVADMPKMKSLYSQFKDQGVEFVGISLDQPEDKGGLTKLKEFVAKNEIGWPQYFQGNFWQSEFSSSWGINSIPALFVVDADGNLASTNGRGKLEELLPKLLQKRTGGK